MRRSRRAFLRRGTAAIASATALAGCSGDDATPTSSFDGPVVEVGPSGDTVFTPGTDEPLRIEAGTRVQWRWRSANHNVVVRDQPADADWGGEPDIHNTGHTYEFTFEVPGEYHYVCEPHERMGMVGDVIVESTE
ncbi:plastocyanin/azurin family copper-binding protein [Halolamina salina]|uniref:Plastocyanin/azurin family copper-binding protein n=1 Tax=Halolamina salina TaxID=1220023 RepID=A0ABD6B7W0_9EURY